MDPTESSWVMKTGPKLNWKQQKNTFVQFLVIPIVHFGEYLDVPGS